MKTSKICKGVIFVLVLFIAWKTLGRASGYEITKGSADYSMKNEITKGSADYSMENGTYYTGLTMQSVLGNLNSCKETCNNTKGCVGFARLAAAAESTPSNCYLQSRLEPSDRTAAKYWNTYAKPGVLLTGVMQTIKPWPRDHINWTYETATDYPGNDMGGITNQYDTSCTNACAKINGCVGVTRQVDRPGYCWFKSSKGKGVFNRNVNSIFLS
jgi:hypothetical protein